MNTVKKYKQVGKKPCSFPPYKLNELNIQPE